MPTKINAMIIGTGGREHATVECFLRSKRLKKLCRIKKDKLKKVNIIYKFNNFFNE